MNDIRVLSVMLLAAAVACSDAPTSSLHVASIDAPEQPQVQLQVPSSTTNNAPSRLTASSPEDSAAVAQVVPPPDDPEAIPMIAFTTIQFSGSVLQGHAEMSYVGSSSKQTMTLEAYKDSKLQASQSFNSADVAPILGAWTATLDGEIITEKCGMLGRGFTQHTASFDLFPKQLLTTNYSNAPIQKQPACTAPSGGGTELADGDGSGTTLIICTTISFYSADGDYLGRSKVCRKEIYYA